MKKKDDFKNFFIGFICVFVFGLAIIPFEYMSVYMFVVFLFVIFCADDSGIRMRLGKRLPRDFPLRRLFSKNRQKPDIRTEYYKTFTFLSLLLMIPFRKLKFVFVGMAILFPVLSIIRYIKHSDVIRFAPQKNEILSSTAVTLLVPTFVFVMITDNQEYNTLYLKIVIGMILLISLTFLVFTKEYRKNIGVLFFFILFVSMFSASAVSVVNKAYDFSERKIHTVRIEDKEEYHGKFNDYILTLEPWGNHMEQMTVSVSQEEYEEHNVGEFVQVVVAKGLLNMEWYNVKIE